MNEKKLKTNVFADLQIGEGQKRDSQISDFSFAKEKKNFRRFVVPWQTPINISQPGSKRGFTRNFNQTPPICKHFF